MNLSFGTPGQVASVVRLSGTPCYVYSPTLAAARMMELRRILGAECGTRVKVAYAVKANPRREILLALAETGCGFDVASLGEFDRVRRLKVLGPRMVFSGPGKRNSEIEEALEAGVRINCEGERDLGLVASWAARQGGWVKGPVGGASLAEHQTSPWPGQVVRVNLRINPRGDGARNIIGGGGPSRFGIDEDGLTEVLTRWRTHGQLRIAGVQVFTASNVRDAAVLARHHRQAFDLAKRVQDSLGSPLDTIDLGGGLGIPYADAEEPLDVVAVARNLAGMLGDSTWFEGGVLLEPGRWISGPTGLYVAQVLEVKWSQGQRFAVLDGGIHHLLRPALFGMSQPCLLLPRAEGESQPTGEPVPTTLGGPLCTGLDILAHDVALPSDLRERDLIAFLQAGAYGETEAMPDFLLHPRPCTAFMGL